MLAFICTNYKILCIQVLLLNVSLLVEAGTYRLHFTNVYAIMHACMHVYVCMCMV